MAQDLDSGETTDPLIGNTVGGYRVIRPIGKGGMGAVYEAVHPYIPKRAALKVMRLEHATNETAQARFTREAQAASAAAHHNLVNILNFGHMEDGSPFLLMEYLEGESLKERLAQHAQTGRRMPVRQAVQIAQQVASAVTVLHAKGIVHRDLKPANLMLVPAAAEPEADEVKVVDFGIAKFEDGGDVSRTTVGRFIGTATYASPEQCEITTEVGRPSDVYSLGVTLYEMLAGRPPFSAPSAGLMIAKHLSNKPAPLSSYAPDCPKDLCELIHQMLAKRPEQRPTMEEVGKRLVAALHLRPRRLRGLQGAIGLGAVALVLGSSGVAAVVWERASSRPRQVTAAPPAPVASPAPRTLSGSPADRIGPVGPVVIQPPDPPVPKSAAGPKGSGRGKSPGRAHGDGHPPALSAAATTKVERPPAEVRRQPAALGTRSLTPRHGISDSEADLLPPSPQ